MNKHIEGLTALLSRVNESVVKFRRNGHMPKSLARAEADQASLHWAINELALREVTLRLEADALIGVLARREMFRDQCIARDLSRAEINSLTFSIREHVEAAFSRAAGVRSMTGNARHPMAAEADRLAGVL